MTQNILDHVVTGATLEKMDFLYSLQIELWVMQAQNNIVYYYGSTIQVSYDWNPDRKWNLQLHLEPNLHTTKNKSTELLKSMNISPEWGSNFPVAAKNAFWIY